jgi:hypothetical protein
VQRPPFWQLAAVLPFEAALLPVPLFLLLQPVPTTDIDTVSAATRTDEIIFLAENII